MYTYKSRHRLNTVITKDEQAVERVESERISCGSFDVSIYIFENVFIEMLDFLAIDQLFLFPRVRFWSSRVTTLQIDGIANGDCLWEGLQYFDTQWGELIKSKTIKCNLLVGQSYQRRNLSNNPNAGFYCCSSFLVGFYSHCLFVLAIVALNAMVANTKWKI